jgi:hypothetical protein
MISIGAVARRNAALLYHRESEIRRIALPKRFAAATRTEQRRATRYSLELELTYSVVYRGRTADTGCGRSIDWSSSGLRFVAERPIGPGQTVELAARWPLALDNGVPLNLVVCGTTVRMSEREIGVRIIRYEFRTRASSWALAADAAKSDGTRSAG